jgi:hypothetical protein
MDNCRFDNWTRKIAAQSDRRTAVKGFAGGIAALATLARVELGLAQEGDVGVEVKCRVNGDGCQQPSQCCSLRCKKRRRRDKGHCKAALPGQPCQADVGCREGVCRGGVCTCGTKDDFCTSSDDCCSNNCVSGKCQCIGENNRCNASSECCGSRTCRTVNGKNICK